MDDESPELESSKLVQMDFIQEVQGVVMSYSNGAMYLYKIESKEVEEVGVLPDGILTGSWAPNQEYLAIASKSGKLLLFTPEFDVMHEAQIDDDDLTFDQGVKEEDKNRSIDDAHISWRGDSSIFVINYSINGGRKCLTREVQKSLQVFKGPARADNAVVFSVSEKPVPAL